MLRRPLPRLLFAVALFATAVVAQSGAQGSAQNPAPRTSPR